MRSFNNFSYTPLTTLGSLPWSSLNLYLPRASKLNSYTSSVSLRVIRIWEIRVLCLSLKRSFNKTASQTDTVVGLREFTVDVSNPWAIRDWIARVVEMWQHCSFHIFTFFESVNLNPCDFVFDFTRFPPDILFN